LLAMSCNRGSPLSGTVAVSSAICVCPPLAKHVAGPPHDVATQVPAACPAGLAVWGYARRGHAPRAPPPRRHTAVARPQYPTHARDNRAQ
jgi:hypothetical protein